MDRIQVCGIWDLGSIPSESTYENTPSGECFHMCSQVSDLRHLRLGIERRSDVALATSEPCPAALSEDET